MRRFPKGLARPARIIVVEDNPPFRDAVTNWLRDVVGAEVVGSAGTDTRALPDFARLRADLLLLGVDAHKMIDLELLRRVKSASAPSRVIVMSLFPPRRAEAAALAAGADGLVAKEAIIEELPRLLTSIFSEAAPAADSCAA